MRNRRIQSGILHAVSATGWPGTIVRHTFLGVIVHLENKGIGLTGKIAVDIRRRDKRTGIVGALTKRAGDDRSYLRGTRFYRCTKKGSNQRHFA